jgi:hypothetical protein
MGFTQLGDGGGGGGGHICATMGNGQRPAALVGWSMAVRDNCLYVNFIRFVIPLA